MKADTNQLKYQMGQILEALAALRNIKDQVFIRISFRKKGQRCQEPIKGHFYINLSNGLFQTYLQARGYMWVSC